MKKELFTVALLISILALSLLNSSKLAKLTDELSAMIEDCGELAYAGKWEECGQHVDNAIRTWAENDTYTHIVLRHNDIDSVTDDIYALREHIYAQDAGETYGSLKLVLEHLESLSSMEKIRLGSIF